MAAANPFPLAFSSTTWTAVGSIATAIAAIVAMASLVRELWKRQEEVDAKTRGQVETIADQTRSLVETLKDASLVIDVAWHIVRSIREQAGRTASVDDMRAIVGDSNVAVTAVVEGWEFAPTAARFRASLADLKASDESLSGRLRVFSPIADLLQLIVEVGYSTDSFVRLLTEETGKLFVKSLEGDDIEALTRSLAAKMHAYVIKADELRFHDALVAIQAFVDIAASGFLQLGRRKLLKTRRARIDSSIGPTVMDELRRQVAGLRNTLPEALLAELADKIETIEKAVSKETATQRLSEEEF